MGRSELLDCRFLRYSTDSSIPLRLASCCSLWDCMNSLSMAIVTLSYVVPNDCAYFHFYQDLCKDVGTVYRI